MSTKPPTIPDEIDAVRKSGEATREQLERAAHWWREHADQLELRIEVLEGRRHDPAEARERRAEREAERSKAALDRARADAIRAIARLLPQAVKQAKAGKPALLRMILRATR